MFIEHFIDVFFIEMMRHMQLEKLFCLVCAVAIAAATGKELSHFVLLIVLLSIWRSVRSKTLYYWLIIIADKRNQLYHPLFITLQFNAATYI